MLLREQQQAVAGDLVAHGDEHQRAGLAFASAHVGDGRGAGQHVADPDRCVELEAAAGPHPPRQAHRRQEAAAARMAVGADLVRRRLRREVDPVPERRQGIAALEAGGVAVERRRQGERRGTRRLVGDLLSASDPGFQGGRFVAAHSPMMRPVGRPQGAADCPARRAGELVVPIWSSQ
jgi:hypothetical protein